MHNMATYILLIVEYSKKTKSKIIIQTTFMYQYITISTLTLNLIKKNSMFPHVQLGYLRFNQWTWNGFEEEIN